MTKNQEIVKKVTELLKEWKPESDGDSLIFINFELDHSIKGANGEIILKGASDSIYAAIKTTMNEDPNFNEIMQVVVKSVIKKRVEKAAEDLYKVFGKLKSERIKNDPTIN